MRSLGFNEYAINCYEDLIRQRIRIGTQDLRIAAFSYPCCFINSTYFFMDVIIIPIRNIRKRASNAHKIKLVKPE